MGNRKARRAAEREEHGHADDGIPLSQPDRTTGAKAKTLYDIAAEREAELSRGQPAKSTNGAIKSSSGSKEQGQGSAEGAQPQLVTKALRPDGSITDLKDGVGDEELLGPLAQALFNAVTLSMIHFTLDVLVHHQYATAVAWRAILRKTLLGLPPLLLLSYAVHYRPGLAGTLWVQGAFLAGSVAAGCHLVRTSSGAGYYAVMQRAPALGTLWVWTVMEMRLPTALASLAAVGGFFWWGGYSIYN